MRIAILQPPYLDAVHYYRLRPWQYLGRQTNTEVTPVSIESPFAFESVIAGYDILIVSRPHTRKHLTAIELAKENGVKVIADYDDLIWSIPSDNPVSSSNDDGNFQYQSSVALFSADCVVCSTAELKREIFERFGVQATIIPNTFNDFTATPDLSERTPSNPIRIAWRGSNTHKGDLLGAKEAFRDWENIQFRFFGYRPDELTKQYGGHLTELHHTAWRAKVSESFRVVKEWKPDYLICPLQDNVFNRCKSNIAWIEATAMGAVCIAPAYMPEFNGVPCLVYDDVIDNGEWLYEPRHAKSPTTNKHFLMDILNIINEGETYNRTLLAARKELINNYLLSRINGLRMQVINSLVEQNSVA